MSQLNLNKMSMFEKAYTVMQVETTRRSGERRHTVVDEFDSFFSSVQYIAVLQLEVVASTANPGHADTDNLRPRMVEYQVIYCSETGMLMTVASFIVAF